MHSRFEMSLMGEMKFFLGLQIHQSPRGIFINQAKYALEILKKHGMEKCDTVGTPMATKPKLDANLSRKLVDQTDYRSKIGSLMYLTFSRLDIVQADSGFELTAFSDVDHAGCLDTRKSTSGGIQFLGDKLVSWMSKKQDYTAMSSVEAEYVTLSAGISPMIQPEPEGSTQGHSLEMNVYKGRMPTKIELTLKQSQQGVSNDVLDAKYEHVSQDTRLQGGKDDQDKQGKDLEISKSKTKSKDNDKVSRSKITQHEGTSLQDNKGQRFKNSTTKHSQQVQGSKI
ncbi:retrovirus-related pol polyprotein from transposon TNT 1-94 [Tanacetum coccineum]